MKKRLFSLFMACVMTLSLAVTAFAAEASEWAVKYDLNGKPGDPITDGVTTEAGKLTTVPAEPTAEGFGFMGWSLAQNDKENLISHDDLATKVFQEADGDSETQIITLYAQWTVKQYTITLNLGNGAEAVVLHTSTEESSAWTLADAATAYLAPTSEGFVFDAWYTQENGAGTKITNLATHGFTGDTPIYANWTEDAGEPAAKDTVTLDMNYGEEPDKTAEIDENGRITVEDPVRDGYWFLGWYSEATKGENCTKYDLKKDTFENGDIIYAHWVEETQEVDSLGGDEVKTEYEVETIAPTIRVIVPTMNAIIINPYQMEVELKAGNTDKSQIISATQYVVNLSDVAIQVSVTVNGAPSEGSGAVLVTTAPKDTETKKSIYLYFEGKEVGCNALGEPNEFAWATSFNKATCVAATAKGASLSKFATLAAADYTTNPGAPIATEVLAFRMTGNVAQAPSSAWTDTDTITVTVSFTFTATATEPPVDNG